jgi:hypothetical protein
MAARIRDSEEPVEQSYLHRSGLCTCDPVNRALHFSLSRFLPAPGFGIIAAMNLDNFALDNFAVGILDHVDTFHDVCIT